MPVLWKKPRKQMFPRPSINDQIFLEQLLIDISSPTRISLGSRKHWLLIVDDCVYYAWSYFLKEKSELPEKGNKLIKEWKAKYNIKVEKIQCDNAGENHIY